MLRVSVAPSPKGCTHFRTRKNAQNGLACFGEQNRRCQAPKRVPAMNRLQARDASVDVTGAFEWVNCPLYNYT